ncbi:DUF2330 domain-containing protein [Reyranella sp. CPCC 100927]|uniref:DUF2330 domain-containing protein n=1 Tax=Reyranella sp. CPCC 100927 TaxID=2599616 RepID=UPI0021057D01|nr:DUF2330 domain-containing protein [Reyranella sp. CPCC 100927]
MMSVVPDAAAFCGFYVGKADTSLFNEASQVILARDGRRTTLSMMNDYKGALTDFALVVPVPVVLRRDQVKVIEKKTFDRLDAYSAPRLAEYFDRDPCEPEVMMSATPGGATRGRRVSDGLGVKVEDSFSVGEYDIVLLSAKESDGLEAWLVQNGYRIPQGAAPALRPYILQGMKFFVAKVNLAAQAKSGAQFLRPLQFTYESEKFMLPMRLGMINASGPQDLIVYVLSREGRVESTNYRTVKLPANMTLPTYLRDGKQFTDFYKTMFDQQARRENYKAVFTEYFWDMSWCDPCAADPLSREELVAAGVSWLPEGSGVPPTQGRRPPPPTGASPVMLTRLHVRYTRDSFPEDLAFQETKDRQNFQARYVLQHPWRGSPDKCKAAADYLKSVRDRQDREAKALANLTGWDVNDIRRRQSRAPMVTPR